MQPFTEGFFPRCFYLQLLGLRNNHHLSIISLRPVIGCLSRSLLGSPSDLSTPLFFIFLFGPFLVVFWFVTDVVFIVVESSVTTDCLRAHASALPAAYNITPELSF